MRREVTILDPNWLTGAIYALINHPTVRDQGGELRYDQLGDLLDPVQYPATRHELILSMMQEPVLGLCLPIARSSPLRYLLPDALPPKEPDYGVWPTDALRFRFQYRPLPTGIIPRFIVEAHQSLTAQPTWWRTGVVLGAERCRILVRADTARDRVEIQVAGTAGQRAALSIVRYHFDAVHRYYAKLKVEAQVPFPDQPEEGVGYDYLVRLEEKKGLDHTFLPERADREYSVRELLEGVRYDETRHRSRVSRRGAPALDSVDDLDGGATPPRPSDDQYKLPSYDPASRVSALRTWPGYVDLSSVFQGAEGWFKLILALITLIPHLLPVKIKALALDVSPASLVYVVYHSLNFYFFMKTRQARAHEAALKLTKEDFDTYSHRYHRYVHRLGYVVYGLIAITVALKLWSQISDLPAIIQRLARFVGIHA